MTHRDSLLQLKAFMGQHIFGQEHLIDRMLIGGGQACSSTPAEKLIALGHRHGVPVYPCISCDMPHFADPQVLRGTAAVLWQSGADGLYLWNYHYIRTSGLPLRGRPLPEDYQYLAELGDPNRLAHLDKIFEFPSVLSR